MPNDPKELAAQVVTAFVTHNKVSIGELEHAIKSAIGLFADKAPTLPPVEKRPPKQAPILAKSAAKPVGKPRPAVPIEESVTPDYIICLEDGRRYRRLGMALRRLRMTAEEYRAKWGLPDDYPMSAANYLTLMQTTMKRSWVSGALSAKTASKKARTPVKPECPAPVHAAQTTALADALRAAVEENPEAAAELPLSSNAAAYVGVPTEPVDIPPPPQTINLQDTAQPEINPAWFNLTSSPKRHDKRPVTVEVRGKHRVKARPPAITGRAQLLNGATK